MSSVASVLGAVKWPFVVFGRAARAGRSSLCARLPASPVQGDVGEWRAGDVRGSCCPAEERMAARVIPGRGLHFDGLPWECADACSYPGRVLRGADSREQRKGRQYQPPVLNPTSGALTTGLVRGRSKTSRSEKVRGRKVSGEANPRTPDSVGRIRWRGEKPHERQIPITNAARRANATTSALQDTGAADFVNGLTKHSSL